MKRVRKQPPPLPIPPARFRFARVRQDPLKAILQRIGLATFLLLVVTFITWFGRKGYVDTQHPDQSLTFIDALYYSTVTITTTGYGDIVPVTQASRLLTTVVVTPIRVLFIVLLVGTTLQVLAEQSRFQFRLRRWQRDLSDHVVVCGFGVKGRSALDYIRNHDGDLEAVVIDTDDAALEEANRLELTGISGKAYDNSILSAARVETAKTVIVALNSDEQAILSVLRIRELNPEAKIIAACKEENNVDLLYSSGATEVIVSSSSAGRILGMAAETPEAARVVNDLLTFGDGLDINERSVAVDGEQIERHHQETAIAVIRNGDVHRPNDDACQVLKAGDKVIYIDQTQAAAESEAKPEELEDSGVS
ncbi:MAG: potassium channel protein [Solirubrobacterales bacterium]|nr:potassium channel protein [Solirubrobacterales bacterium]